MEQNSEKIIEEDYENFTEQLELIKNSNPTNILDQLPAYNYDETNSFINNLKNELDQQKTLNLLLEKKNYKKNLENIKKFTELNSDKVEKQLSEIKETGNLLKEIISKNDKLKKDNSELIELSKGKEFQKLANNMREIKKEKESIKLFLEKIGITTPPLIL